MATLHLILARAANGVIGLNNTLPWRLPEDLAHFKRTTMGSPVLMGRKTWDSLPPRFRPLPGRINIVLTRDTQWQADGALRAASVQEAIDLSPVDAKIWVTGGAEVYAQAMARASTAVVTEIEADFEGDAFAPRFGEEWQEVERERHVSASGLGFSFVILRNTAVAAAGL